MNGTCIVDVPALGAKTTYNTQENGEMGAKTTYNTQENGEEILFGEIEMRALLSAGASAFCSLLKARWWYH